MKDRVSKREALADGLFDSSLTARERAIFEGAITLGAIYHQFVGIPVSKERRVLDLLERTISETMRLQPYKERVTVHIKDPTVRSGRADPFGYSELEGKNLEAEVISRYKGYRAIVAMKYVPELKYNLMYVKQIEKVGHGHERPSRPKRPLD
jgi:dihydroneopterin aldolase